MTPAQLRRRVAYWQRKLAPLGLQHWRIGDLEINDAPDGESSSAACVTPSNLYDTFTIEFRRDFLEDAEPEQIDEVIVHELIHIAFRDFQTIVESPAGFMDTGSKELWETMSNHELEGLVERLARTIVNAYN